MSNCKIKKILKNYELHFLFTPLTAIMYNLREKAKLIIPFILQRWIQ